jgi:putative septum site-determining protein minC
MKLFLGNNLYFYLFKKLLYAPLKGFFIVLFLILSTFVMAQKPLSIHVKVCLQNGKSIENVSVLLNGSLQSVSNKQGFITFRNLKKGEYTYTATCIGYEDTSGKIVVNADDNPTFTIVMQPLTLQLNEVHVTAQQKTMGSASIIGQDAIRHLQPKSVADLLQLLPGSLTTNPSLNTIAQANIREMSVNDNNSLGTSIIIDGAPQSNDANLQALSTAKSGTMASNKADGMNLQTSVSKGIDLRSISADNIERIEVIRGIPSAEYGNLTSGVVLIKTKKGETPLEMKLKTDPFSKLVYIGKGFAYKKHSTTNVSVDYSQSYPDTRRRYRGFERITSSLSFGTIWNSNTQRPISFNLFSSFYSNINNYKSDAQLKDLGLAYTNENVGGRITINGDVKMNKWVSAINYDVSAQVAHLKDTHHSYVANPDGIVTNALISGESVANFLTKPYYSDYFIEGIPYHLYALLKANKYIQLRSSNFTNIKFGIEYKLDGNRGKGLVFNMANPPQSISTQTLRPRSHKDISPLSSLSAFAEDNLSLKVGSGRLQAMYGMRISTLFINKEQAKRSSITVFEPRINAEYTFLTSQNNSIFDKLSLSLGWGVAYKMPPLLYLYPDKAYFDSHSLSFKNSDKAGESLAIMSTKVIDNVQNTMLQPTKNTKFEVSLNGRIGKINGQITVFHEENKNEFGFDGVPEFLQYKKYQVPMGATNLRFNEHQVYYSQNNNPLIASYKTENEIVTWNKPANNSISKKLGIEYSFNFGTCKWLSTSLTLDGAWFYIKRKNTNNSLQYVNKLYPYIGILPAGEGTISSRVNSNFRLITHLSALKMVFTTTLQVVWHEQYRSFYETKDGGIAYQLSSDKTQYEVSPIGFYNKWGEYNTWTNSNNNAPELQQLKSGFLLYAFQTDKVSPWALLNFRLTKELGKVAELSFMANNFLNSSKFHINKHSLGRRELYPDLYFGAELKLKL